MAGFLTAEITPNVSNFLQQLAQGLAPAIAFGAEQARVYLKNVGLGEFIQEIALSAGNGFPISYRNHLAVAMYNLPLTVVNNGEGIVEIVLNIDPLGGQEDLLKGAHQNAMLASNQGDTFRSFRISTKPQLQRVQLPYGGGDLLNSPERRLEWWNNVIVEQNTPYTMVGANWNWTKPSIRTQQDAWIAENIPTFEQVASARASMWRSLGVAPEWTLLEYGTPAGSKPVIEPQNFKLRLSEYMWTIGNKYIEEAVIAFERLVAERSVIGVSGPQARPYNVLGQYVPYKDLIL